MLRFFGFLFSFFFFKQNTAYEMRISDWSSDVCSSDQRWTNQLSRQVRSADVELVAEFSQIQTSISELMKLQIGDVLPIEIHPTITAHVGGVPVMECGDRKSVVQGKSVSVRVVMGGRSIIKKKTKKRKTNSKDQ